MNRPAWIMAAMVLGLLAACGSGDPPSEDSQRQSPAGSPASPVSSGAVGEGEGDGASGSGEYTAVNEGGASLTITVPTAASAPEVAKVERFRQAAAAPQFTYVSGVLDNGSTQEVNTLDLIVRVVTESGRQVNIPTVAAPEVGVFEKYVLDRVDAAGPYYGRFYDNQSLSPGAKQTVIFATAQKVPSVKSVWVVFEQYGDGVQAWRSDEGYRP